MAVFREAIIQLGYVVRPEKFDDCIEFWREVMGAGPFYFGEFQLDDQIYRGKPTAASVGTAIAYFGDMQIEIIKQTNDAPSPYVEWLDRHEQIPRGGLLHHQMIDVPDYDATFERLTRNGIASAFTGTIAGKDRLTYMDATDTLGCFIEFLDAGHPFRSLFDIMRRETAEWDGLNPLRQVADLMPKPLA